MFCLYFILYLHVWIRICIRNTDPDSRSSWIRIQYGPGSTTQDHNTGYNSRQNTLMTKTQLAEPVMQIRIRLDPELSPGSESKIIVPDPAKIERADK